MTSSLLIVGASARAAAHSAARAGLRTTAIDLFCDADLQQIAETRRCPPAAYPAAIPRMAQTLPESPYCYTGGLENHPRVLDELSQDRPLLGNPPTALARCRDPFTFAHIVRAHGLASAAPARDTSDHSFVTRWLKKPLKSCGGTGTQFTDRDQADPGHYLQQYIPGSVYSGSFVADQENCHLLCVAEQFTARQLNRWFPHAFGFGGCRGPLPLNADQTKMWSDLGTQLATAFELQGLFGVDAVWSPHRPSAQPVLLELNPRFTASMELYDANLPDTEHHRSAIALHLSCFESQQLARPHVPTDVYWKVIVYARQDLPVTQQLLSEVGHSLGPHQWLADVPTSPQRIRRGSPVLTVLGREQSVDRCGVQMGVATADPPPAQILATVAGVDELLGGRYQTNIDCTP